eukprot:5733198-Prymnesium_polylepis.1
MCQSAKRGAAPEPRAQYRTLGFRYSREPRSRASCDIGGRLLRCTSKTLLQSQLPTSELNLRDTDPLRQRSPMCVRAAPVLCAQRICVSCAVFMGHGCLGLHRSRARRKGPVVMLHEPDIIPDDVILRRRLAAVGDDKLPA